jgi:hypothetical protein
MRPKPLTPAQSSLASRLAPAAHHEASFEPAVVDGAIPGGAADGATLATVTWRGTPRLPVPYRASYTPTVGDVVLLLIQGPQVIIMGRIAGTPNSPPVDDPESDGLSL